jgi:hypothetical protein
MLNAVCEAEVSTPAACLALCQSLPSGYVFAQINDGIVRLSDASPGSAVRAPTNGECLDVKEFGRNISQRTKIQPGSNTIYWWHFQTTELADDPDDERSASEILSEILDSLRLNTSERQKLQQQINGVIGAANSFYKTDSSIELFGVFQQRFASRKDLSRCVAHPKFDLFLSRRSSEITARR